MNFSRDRNRSMSVSKKKQQKGVSNGNSTNLFENEAKTVRFFSIREKPVIGQYGPSFLLETLMVVKRSFTMKDIRDKLEVSDKSKLWINGRQGNFARLHISALFEPTYKRFIVSETVPDIKLMVEYHYCSNKSTKAKVAEMFQKKSYEFELEIKKKHDTLQRLGLEIDQLTKKLNYLKKEEEKKKKKKLEEKNK